MNLVSGKNVKIRLTCPQSHVNQVRMAIGDAGIGTIGEYTHCSVVFPVIGHFRPTDKAHPHIGECNQIQQIEEMMIEFVCLKDQVALLYEILDVYHPYEEVAIDIMSLLDLKK